MKLQWEIITMPTIIYGRLLTVDNVLILTLNARACCFTVTLSAWKTASLLEVWIYCSAVFTWCFNVFLQNSLLWNITYMYGVVFDIPYGFLVIGFFHINCHNMTATVATLENSWRGHLQKTLWNFEVIFLFLFWICFSVCGFLNFISLFNPKFVTGNARWRKSWFLPFYKNGIIYFFEMTLSPAHINPQQSCKLWWHLDFSPICLIVL